MIAPGAASTRSVEPAVRDLAGLELRLPRQRPRRGIRVEPACDHRDRRRCVRARGRRDARARRRAGRRARAGRGRHGLGDAVRQAAPAHGSLAVRPSGLPDPAAVREVAGTRPRGRVPPALRGIPRPRRPVRCRGRARRPGGRRLGGEHVERPDDGRAGRDRHGAEQRTVRSRLAGRGRRRDRPFRRVPQRFRVSRPPRPRRGQRQLRRGDRGRPRGGRRERGVPVGANAAGHRAA